MGKWRCVNRIILGYCSGEPSLTEREIVVRVTVDRYACPDGIRKYNVPDCNLNPETCGKYQTLSEQLADVDMPNLDNTYRHTVKAEKSEKSKGKAKTNA